MFLRRGRTCCPPGQIYSNDTRCVDATEEQMAATLEHEAFSQFNISERDNFDLAPSYARVCPKGFTANRMLKPHERCNDHFWFIGDEDSDGGRPKLDSLQLEMPTSSYCLAYYENGTMAVEVCTRERSESKFSYVA